MSSEVIAAITARKVMYWTTRRKPNSGPSVCSHVARLSSMVPILSFLLSDRLDHALHRHEARALHQHDGRAAQLRHDGGVECLDALEMLARHRARLLAQRQQPLDAALARV